MLQISLAVIKLTAIAVLGFYFYKRKFIDQRVLDFLIFFVINFAFPFLGFSHIVESLHINSGYSIGMFVLVSIAIFFVSFILGFLFSFKRKHDFKKEFISLVAFQNCGYLPLSIAVFFLPAQLSEEFIIYNFMYILGFDVMFWSVGSFLIFKKKGEEFKLKSILTPPIVATVLALFFVYSGLAKFIPSVILSPMKMVGDTSFVLSMIILGCWLAKISTVNLYKRVFIVLEASLLKLVLLPFIFLLIMLKLDIVSLFGLFVVLQAAMPSAVSLPIVANLRKADSEFVSQGVLLSHILSIVTIPVWVGLYMKFSHFSF